MFTHLCARFARSRAARPIRNRLLLRCLEDRIAPANLIVSDAGDNGGSNQLRAIWDMARSNGEADTITFDPSVTLIALSSVLPTYSEAFDLTISGNGKTVTTIVAPAGTRIFDLNVPSAQPWVTITDLTLKGGSSSGNGGAIQDADEALALTNVRFTQNTAVAGGAVAIKTAATVTVTVTGCDFTFNTATNAAVTVSAGGGAIYLGSLSTNTNTITINNSIFDGNQAGTGGSAIYLTGNLLFNCDSTTFKNGNSLGASGLSGGAILVSGGTSSTLTIDHATVTGNSTAFRGGMVHFSGYTQATIQNSTISSNSAAGNGGAIAASAYTSQVTLINDIFSKNSATLNGGAISSFGTFNISSSIFSGHTASGSGGALYSAGPTSVNSCDFVGNVAKSSGGALFAGGKTMVVSNSTLRSNSAISSGGGLTVGAATVTINQCTFNRNSMSSSSNGGGAIAATGAGTLTINNSTIYDNTASSGGGGIWRSISSATLNINSTIIAGNKLTNASPTRGRDFNNSAGNATVVGNNTLFGTTAGMGVFLTGTYQGGSNASLLDPLLSPLADNGGITLPDGTKLKTMVPQLGSPALYKGNNSVAFVNDARGAGFPRLPTPATTVGALEPYGTSPAAILLNAPTISSAGSANATFDVQFLDDIAINTTTIDVNDITVSGPGFTSQKAIAASFVGSGSSVTATYTIPAPTGGWGGLNPANTFNFGAYTVSINANQVGDLDTPVHFSPATGIGALNTNFALSYSVSSLAETINGNYAPGNLTFREAVALANQKSGTLVDTITFDTAYLGASPTITLSSGTVALTTSVVITGPSARVTLNANNTNQQISLASSKTLTISNVNFTNFSATSAGGALTLNSSSTTTLTNTTFSGNYSSVRGGAISGPTSGNLTVIGGSFANNTTLGSGGAIYGGRYVTIDSTTFTGNSAGQGGGAIASAFFGVSNSVFSGNKSASRGGAIYNSSTGSLNSSANIFSNNTAASDGGAIYLYRGFGANIINSFFSENTAGGAGGAAGFLQLSGTSSVSNCTFFENNSKTNGGALYVQDGSYDFTFRNSTFSKNTAGANGGGLQISRSGNAFITNCTIADNVVSTSAVGLGGGVNWTNGSLVVESSVISGNILPAGVPESQGPDLAALGMGRYYEATKLTIISSAIGVNAGFTITTGSNNQLGTPIELGPLANYGGFELPDGSKILTRLPAPGSPVRDAGSNPATLTFDQRGIGFDRVQNGTPDIGALESLDSNPIAKMVDPPNITTTGNSPFSFDVRYSASVAIDSTTFDVNDVTVTGPGYGTGQKATGYSISGAGSAYTVTYTIPAPIGGWGAFNANNTFNMGTYSVTLGAGEVADTSAVPLYITAGQIGAMRASFPTSFMVDNASDVDDGNYSVGQMSLREAIKLANIGSSADTINFNLPANTTITLTAGYLLSGSVFINGPGADKLTIDANKTGRHFAISPQIKAAISGLKLSNGQAEFGGSISTYHYGDLTLDGMWITSSTATSDRGGAIWADGTFTMTNSTLSGNSAASAGGAIYCSTSLQFVISSCTLSNNFAPVGGALGANVGFLSSISITHSTIASNSASTRGGGLSLSNYVNVVLQNSIVSGNTSINSPDIYQRENGYVINSTTSLIGKVSSNSIVNMSGTLSGTEANPLDAKLGPLANNGGPTPTHALLPSSPAIDRGYNFNNLTYDQRGSGYLRISGPRTDIGAFEYQYPPPRVISVRFGDGSIQRSMVRQLEITFSKDVTFPPSVASAFTLSRTGTGGPIGDVILTADPSSGVTNFVTLTFSGSLTESGGSLVDGLYSLIIDAAQVSGEGGLLDGNNDGIPGGSYTVIGTTANRFYRLFGDSNGDGTVSQVQDLGAFRLSFMNGPSTIFDFDNDGQVSQPDFNAFRLRFLGSP